MVSASISLLLFQRKVVWVILLTGNWRTIKESKSSKIIAGLI